MKILNFTPFGCQRKESSLIGLLSTYLAQFDFSISHVVCNGVFSLCDRDAATSWRRGMTSCLACSTEQNAIATYSGAKIRRLSEFLQPDDIQDSRRWVLKRDVEQLLNAKFRGIQTKEVILGTFARRFGHFEPDLRNQQHREFLEKLSLTCFRMFAASFRCVEAERPTLIFSLSSDDTLSRCFSRVAESLKLDLVSFRSEEGSRYIKIFRPHDSKVYPCELRLESIAELDRAVDDWPSEIVQIVEEILEFLGLSHFQLSLPIAQ